MNFFGIIVNGYITVAIILIAIIVRDQKKDGVFLNRQRALAWFLAALLALGIIAAIDVRYIEPWFLKTTRLEMKMEKITTPVKIAFVSDLQVGKYKKTAWTEKIVKKIDKENPDLVLLGGDLVDNEGTFEDESVYLEPLQKLAQKYPVYYVLGNHEYGIGSATMENSSWWTGDRSKEVMDRMKKIGVKLLRDDLKCVQIKTQKLCVFGADDFWKQWKINFKNLKIADTAAPLIFLAHNPDAVLFWDSTTTPDLMLAGHSHGGQIWLPFMGPLGHPGIALGEKFYRGLNYFTMSLRGPALARDEAISKQDGIASPSARNDIPLFTSVGAGESGAPIRLFNRPEVVVIELKKL
jgi:predicted MPP superfamily phosphohydrolase